MENSIVVGTHNGVFHPDEVLAIAIIELIYNVRVIRSRDPKVLADCTLLVDVGGGKYDPHIPGGGGKRKNSKPYSSCGLVWKDFGRTLISNLGASTKNIEKCFENIDAKIIQPVDDIANGLCSTSPFIFIESFLPNWDMENAIFYHAFMEALDATKLIFKKMVEKEITNLAAEQLLNSLLAAKDETNILEIPCHCFPWQNRVIIYNRFETKNRKVDFVIFPYPSGGYAAQCVPKDSDNLFSQRIPFPEEWAVQTDNLPDISSVPTATFCHNNLFFVRATTKEGVIELCNIATERFYKGNI